MVCEVAHRHVELLSVGRASAELLLARVCVAEPRARDEIRRYTFVSLKIPVEREQHEGVLLRVLPAPTCAVREQAARDLRDEVAFGLVADERFEDDAVGAPARMKKKVIVVAVTRREVRRPGGLLRAVIE